MTILIDSSIFLATVFPTDINHRAAVEAFRRLKGGSVVAVPVLLEVFQIVVIRLSYDDAIKAFTLIDAVPFLIEMLNDTDMGRMRQIMTQYKDAKFDFADTAIFALAERLNINKIYTFDCRDFSIFRPVHTPYLELLP